MLTKAIRIPKASRPTEGNTRFNSGGVGSWGRLILTLGVAAAVLPQAVMYGQTVASDGAMVLKGLTLPRGGVWLANNAGGGHWWQSDGVFGFCRVDPAPGANPPFTTTNSGTAGWRPEPDPPGRIRTLRLTATKIGTAHV